MKVLETETPEQSHQGQTGQELPTEEGERVLKQKMQTVRSHGSQKPTSERGDKKPKSPAQQVR